MKYRSQIPNLFTLLNLAMGILAIISVFYDQYGTSAFLIITAGVLDRLDGQLARKLNVESEFGKELDSLCDLISFGVAPAILMWHLNLMETGALGIGATVLFAVCGASRLARYNISEFEGVYMGIPITLCGGIVALMSLYSTRFTTSMPFMLVSMLFLSYAMVSKRIKLKKR
ncbi:CDP-diacylglycerol--serine O-phosphatidyltransferase [Geosporobacter ferrireducens]|uniref:CDP-diacylglycerol--serine O-phosphatidyltransferase n=1 Tax=Geosporobacter ferrireducens TaxID=1424294 RepID=A0A1D8GN74_9FIRM|nr:CDP-diacylglycerol--serine O-phosphatidyltransferase [Geosporobacter ferrireducens]AOT72343.1 CDP-diacylglycerol--serine O-phosphatidyltransferase [Geosporobacter ferrireducens]MTI56402.1 CDP-diacylglycerol--serine O-phosphatidyltransferase [Geosporobacter ferrireducens]